MTYYDAKEILMNHVGPTTPEVWEAYYVVYKRRHPKDPLLDAGSQDANRERIYKSTEQGYREACCPYVGFEEDPEGTMKIGKQATPYKLNPHYFATENTALFLAEKLNATAFKLPGPDNVFGWPAAWWLEWETGDSRNAGAVANVWNKAVTEFRAIVDLWNTNLGTNNPVGDPELRTPDVLVLRKLELETGTDLDDDGDVAGVPVED